MSEFLRYVLWELRRYSVLILLAGLLAGIGFRIADIFYRRRHGKRFPWKKLLLPLLFSGYLLVVLFATNFRTSGISREVNLHLFRAWREALNNFSAKRWLNVMLNIAMFCPFGFLLPILGRKFRKWYMTIPAGFGFSLSIELLQLIFARGVFDVDDIFCNSLGAILGYFAVMVILSFRNEKGQRWKPVLVYTCLLLVVLSGICSVFLVYHTQEFGNLPQASAYRVNTTKTTWNLDCELPEIRELAPVYRIQSRSTADCDSFADGFQLIIPTEFEDVSYYEEAAYYMDHGNGDGAHFLFVHYLDQGYEYTAIYEDMPVWADFDREKVLQVLEKYPVEIPEAAEFASLGDGWHNFTVNQMVMDGFLFDGTLAVRIAEDGSVLEIENHLLSYLYVRDAEIITPEEAWNRLRKGYFQDEGGFRWTEPGVISVRDCTLEYRVDTKGFYQPVYAFGAESVDGSYRYQILIPAIA